MVLIMTTNLNQSGGTWIVTLRQAAAGSTATVYPESLGLTACAAPAGRPAAAARWQTVWTCALAQPEMPEAASRDMAVAGMSDDPES
jgi:hypothetical protein